MELRITNKQVNKIFNEDGDLDREEVQGINYEVIEGDRVVGSANIYQGGFSLSVHNLQDESIDEIQSIVEGLLLKSEEPEAPAEGGVDGGEEMPVDGEE